MPSAKVLNGLPNNLVQMYFSTHAYYRNGYMPDHLWDIAARAGILEARIDVLGDSIEPADFSKPALISYLTTLRGQITSELARMGFPQDYITEAYIDIFISKKHQAQRLLTGTGTIITKEGRTIKGKTFTESAFPLRGKAPSAERPWWKFW